MLRQQADAYSEQLIVDTRILWEERQRLIQDIRQLADEVLATAEDASERVSPAGADQRAGGARGGRGGRGRRPSTSSYRTSKLCRTAPRRGRPPARSSSTSSRAAPKTTPTRANFRITAEPVGRLALAARARLRVARAASSRAPRRPVDALLFVAFREVPKPFEKRRPIGPGALPPARCPTPSVRSTPRCGLLDSRGTRKPRMSRIDADSDDDSDGHVDPRTQPGCSPQTVCETLTRGEAEAGQDADAGRRAGGHPAARVEDGRAAAERVASTGSPPRRSWAPAPLSATTPRRPRAVLQRGARGLPSAGAARAAPDDEGLAGARRAPPGRPQGRDGEARPGGALRPPDVHAADDGPADPARQRRNRSRGSAASS